MKELRKILFEINRVPNFLGISENRGVVAKVESMLELLIINRLAGIQKVCQGDHPVIRLTGSRQCRRLKL
jgi:hypothetical protein